MVLGVGDVGLIIIIIIIIIITGTIYKAPYAWGIPKTRTLLHRISVIRLLKEKGLKVCFEAVY